MSEPIREINGNMVDLPSQINQLESDNAALETKIKKLKSELNGKLFQQSKDDIRRLNEQLTAYSEKEIAIMDDFSAALRHLNDSVSDLQAILSVEKGEEEQPEVEG